MNKIAVITGANSMDGKTLTHLLLSKDYTVILTYRRNTLYNEENIRSLFTDELMKYRGGVDFEICDITDHNSVKECILSILKKYGKIDELYLIAAMSHVGNSFKQKEYSIICNGQSYYYFLETLKTFSPTTRTYGALTSELAGNVPDGQLFNEESPWNPKSPYGYGKALAGYWIRHYRECSDSNLFCCYGVLMNHSNCYRTRDFLIRKVTSTFAKIVLGKEKKLKLAHLNFARDEHWSDFGCEMMWKMLQNEYPTDYVIGNGETHWGEEYLDIAADYFNLNWPDYVEFDDSLNRPNEVVRLIADPSKAERELGWRKNRISFKKHIALMCDFDYKLESGLNPTRPNVFEMFP